MTEYAPTDFHADQWSTEPLTQTQEEQRLQDLFSAYVQRYQGDRDLSWLEDQAFEESFGSMGWEGDHELIRMFVEFTRCIVVVDERDDSRQTCLTRIRSFFQGFQSIVSTNPVIQGIIEDMRLQLVQRREYLLALPDDGSQQQRRRRHSSDSDSSLD